MQDERAMIAQALRSQMMPQGGAPQAPMQGGMDPMAAQGSPQPTDQQGLMELKQRHTLYLSNGGSIRDFQAWVNAGAPDSD